MRCIFIRQIIFVTSILPIDYGTKTATIIGKFSNIGDEFSLGHQAELIEKIKLLNGQIVFEKSLNETAFKLDIVIDVILPTYREGATQDLTVSYGTFYRQFHEFLLIFIIQLNFITSLS